MGLPKISIAFRTAGISAIKRGERGIVALILKDDTNLGMVTVTVEDEIPTNLSQTNTEQIRLALMGTVNPPKKVIAYILPTTAGYADAMVFLETVKWDYLAIPDIVDSDKYLIATWIKALRDTRGKKVKAVLPEFAPDSEGIINFATNDIKTASKIYSAKNYCSRIAGILAGLPLTISATYQALSEVEDVPHLTESDMNIAIDSGKLILFHDGEKVKIARAVNSLVSTTPDKGEDFKKIKIVDILDLIHTDVKKTSEDNYIGKVANSYDNKCLLISAIKSYFEALEMDGLLEKGKNSVYIDIAVQANYLKSNGIDITGMNSQQIKEANTRDKVFLASNIKAMDAVEDIVLNIIV